MPRLGLKVPELMRKAADILASKPAMQIRYLDAMQEHEVSGIKGHFMPSAQEIEHGWAMVNLLESLHLESKEDPGE